MHRSLAPRALAAAALLAAALPARADEGMWLINRPPVELLKERYGFQPSAAWIEQMQKSAVDPGASGSFVSAEGLVLTNHHVAYDDIEKLSTADRNLVRDGFLARTRAQELRCPGAEVRVLWSIEDVTAQVHTAMGAETPPDAAADARRAAINRIQDAAKAKTGLECEVITLYRGARYHLYSFKRYTDVRLVFAPEGAVASFGGDTDNFEYPRFALDVSLLRVYENGEPAKPDHHLPWSDGAADGDLVFAFGHPGRTERQLTLDQLRLERDVLVPQSLSHVCMREVQLNIFSGRSAEHARIALGRLLGAQNWRKATVGLREALLTPEIFAAKQAQEHKLRGWARDRAAQHPGWATAWDRIAAVQPLHAQIAGPYGVLESGWSRGGQLMRIARWLVRLAAEKPKPSEERIEGYSDAELDALYLRLFSPEPIYPALETHMLSLWLSEAANELGAEDFLIAALLNRLPPRERASLAIAGTKLQDIEFRRRLAEGGKAALDAAKDPLIDLALLVDVEARKLRTRHEQEVEAVEQAAHADIAAARFARDGEGVYPDATGTLRMSFGTIKGYREGDLDLPPFTTFAGLYQRAEQRRGQPAFELPRRWIERRDRLNLATPLNLVCTADIIGGNSGSPLVNRAGELVGLVFDGNLQGLAWDYVYDDVQARCIAVDSRAIIEALRNVYDAEHLVKEILGQQ